MLRTFLLLTVGLVALAPSPGWTASIGLFSDADCTSCNLDVPVTETRTLYINVVTTGLVDDVTGAAFKVIGLPESWTVTSMSNANVVIGDPFDGSRANLAFPTGQAGECVNLFTVEVTATTSESNLTLAVTTTTPPVLSNFDCPVLTLDTPLFGVICVDGGELFLNSDSSCAVSVAHTTWSAIRVLYR